MAWTLETSWWPTKLLAVAGSADTSTGATEVETDAGRAYLKPLGNRQDPHVLATDWVGTHLPKWFGLSTFDIALLNLQPDDAFDLPRGAKAKPGPAFVAKAMAGEPRGKSRLPRRLFDAAAALSEAPAKKDCRAGRHRPD